MSADTENRPVDLGRRRLTQGGLAGSVLLASLVSKNALADVPYHCSVSGKVSGNHSPYGPNKTPGAGCNIGSTEATIKSRLVNDTRTFSGVFNKEIFAKRTGDPASPKIEISFQTISGGEHATLYQVLAANVVDLSIAADLSFCRAAIVLHENATDDRSQYPLTKQDVTGMFNAAIAQKPYFGNSSVGPFEWTPEFVRNYFASLYH